MQHYFTNSELPSELHQIQTTILDNKFTFYTDNGVFSKEKLDFGTRLFLESLPLLEFHGDVLDVGCGYGPIGIVVSKLTGSNVTMVDINRRALHLAERNAKENGISNYFVLESNGYQNLGNQKFDFILTNPPIHAGKKVVYEILMKAREYLRENGKLFLVVRKDQGAKSMISDLEKCYHKVSVLERSKGFFIICCELS